jgi:hypothetical protein
MSDLESPPGTSAPGFRLSDNGCMADDEENDVLDAVCWLSATCESCGALVEDATCWNCGAARGAKG